MTRVILRTKVPVVAIRPVCLGCRITSSNLVTQIRRTRVPVIARNWRSGTSTLCALIRCRTGIAVITRIVRELFMNALVDFVTVVLCALICIITVHGLAETVAVQTMVVVRADASVVAWDVDVHVRASCDLVARIKRARFAI